MFIKNIFLIDIYYFQQQIQWTILQSTTAALIWNIQKQL